MSKQKRRRPDTLIDPMDGRIGKEMKDIQMHISWALLIMHIVGRAFASRSH